VCVHFLLHKSFPRSCSTHRPCVTLHNSVFLYGKQLLRLAQSPCWKTTPVCWPSMTGHSVYLTATFHVCQPYPPNSHPMVTGTNWTLDILCCCF
jgi:hypothetical protein